MFTLWSIAFGGVPTGNRKEYEHIVVAGTIRYSGWISIATHYRNTSHISWLNDDELISLTPTLVLKLESYFSLTIWAITGNVMFAMPTFEVNSVIVPMNMETRKRMTKVGKCRNGTRASPILLAKQEAILPLDMANPPPRRNIKLQGIFVSITCHVIDQSFRRCGRSFGSYTEYK